MDHLVDVIKRPASRRSDADVNAARLWLQRRTELMAQLDNETVLDILKNCSYQTAERDDLILRQGEKGQCMYVILNGAISVYIDPAISGDEPGPAPHLRAARDSSTGSPDKGSIREQERAQYGKFIVKYRTGKHFGEAALLAEDQKRSATILADDCCQFLVIDHDLFDRCLKVYQEREFRAMQEFVDSHRLFAHMTPRYKRMLVLSLRREHFAFESPVVTQGLKHSALYFLIEGQAKVYVQPGKHQKQYPHLWPFEVGSDVYAREFEWLRKSRQTQLKNQRESRRKTILHTYEDPAVWQVKPEALTVRRKEGYAASEKFLHDRTVCLCSVTAGEVIGDVELVQGLTTYMSSVVCTTHSQAFVLDIKNLERVTGKRNMLTQQLMKQEVIAKLQARLHTQQGQQVPLLSFLLTKLTEQQPPDLKELPPLKTSKTLPSKEVQTQYLLQRFREGKAELVESAVPGTLVYKELMRERARIRSNIQRRGGGGPLAVLRDTRRRLNRRKPRSRRALVTSLKEMIEADLLHPAVPERNKGTSKTKPAQDKERTKTAASTAPSNNPQRLPSLPAMTDASVRATGGRSTRPALAKDAARPNAGGQVRSSIRHKTDSARKVPSPGKHVRLPPLDSDGDPGLSPTPAALHQPPAPQGPATAGLVADVLTLPRIQEEGREGSLEATARGDEDQTHVSSARYVRREVPASSDGRMPPSGSAKRLPPLAKVELRRPEHTSAEQRWTKAMRLLQERLHDSQAAQLLAASHDVSVFQASEISMQLLESKIRQFHVRQGQLSPVKLNLKLPKLRRFKLDLEIEKDREPKPGGKVWIKKRLCRVASGNFQVKDHEHIRYHIVEALPEFDKVKQMQAVVRQLMEAAALRQQKELGALEAAQGDLSQQPVKQI